MKAKKQLYISGLTALAVWIVWLALLGPATAYDIVQENWPISLTMVIGSVIAGATSEGGGAVAFPVFTKLLHIPPKDAKVFSLAIQSIGMSAASLVIVLSRIPVEWRVILWASIGGAIGIVAGAVYLAPHIPPDITKITFTVMASSFAIVLLMINRRDRRCHTTIPADGLRERSLLLIVGLLGGLISSLVGTGLDIITFSMIVLLFRLSEKIATPTSVVLMAGNSIIGLLVFGVFHGPLKAEVFSYWMAAIPVVVVGAPLGAIICASLSRRFIANTLVGLISIELVSTLIIIHMRWQVVMMSTATLIGCLLIYTIMMRSKRYEPNIEAV